jgi:hypothetical protein
LPEETPLQLPIFNTAIMMAALYHEGVLGDVALAIRRRRLVGHEVASGVGKDMCLSYRLRAVCTIDKRRQNVESLNGPVVNAVASAGGKREYWTCCCCTPQALAEAWLTMIRDIQTSTFATA